MRTELSSLLSPELFGLDESHLSWLDDHTIVVNKWDWDYSQAHLFQKSAVAIVQEHPVRILICTSHPEVLTHGRGLQRPRKGEELGLVEFRLHDSQNLPYPLHSIERGGGLTFHHPGQFIFYPILRLNPKHLSLSKMIDQMFDFSISVLSDWGMKGLHHQHKLLGLWFNERKIASMGIAVEKLVTFHGMALNLLHHPGMKEALASLNPCGLASSTYISAEEIIPLPPQALDAFKEEFLKRIRHEWK